MVLNSHLRNGICWIVAACMVGSCTHMPSGEKAFKTFDECIAANMLLSTGVAIGVGILTARATRSGAAGGVAGGATAVVLLHTAWKRCGAVYARTTTVAETRRETMVESGLVSPAASSTLVFEKFEGRIDQQGNAISFDLAFAYIADNPEERDITSQIRHRLEIVRMGESGGQLVLVDADGKPLLDARGQAVLVSAFRTVPPERLAYEVFYDRSDKEIIQQGSRTIRHELPANVPNLQLPVPMRYTVTVTAGRFQGDQTLEYFLPEPAERPQSFAARKPANIIALQGPAPGPLMVASRGAAPLSTSGATAGTASSRAGAASAPTVDTQGGATPVTGKFLTKVAIAYYEAAGAPKALGRLPPNSLLEAEAQIAVSPKSGKPVQWLKVRTQQGLAGWVRKADVVELK